MAAVILLSSCKEPNLAQNQPDLEPLLEYKLVDMDDLWRNHILEVVRSRGVKVINVDEIKMDMLTRHDITKAIELELNSMAAQGWHVQCTTKSQASDALFVLVRKRK